MKITVPDGGYIVMSKDIFEQDPEFFMKMMVGSLLISRVVNGEADRLEGIFDRDWIKKILDVPYAKQSKWTYEDYQLILNACI